MTPLNELSARAWLEVHGITPTDELVKELAATIRDAEDRGYARCKLDHRIGWVTK